MSIVYAHINKINNKTYIGITNQSDPNQRWGIQGAGYKGSKFWEKGINQFGWDNFEHKILNDQVDNWTAAQIEARLIKELDLTSDSNGYNEDSGAIIVYSEEADIVANHLIKEILQKKEKNYLELLQTDYKYVSNNYTLDYLYDLWKKNKINTELDCQRGYVWTSDRQQGMWDTLLKGQMIPEFHTIRSGMNYEVIDGKQRITTIMKIINNEIPLKKPQYNSPISCLFKEGVSKITFLELPLEVKEKILNTSLRFCEYSEISEDGIMELFKKLNMSMQLSEFGRGIAENIYIRLKYTSRLIDLPYVNNFFSDASKKNNDDELNLVRLLLLLKYGAIGLEPKTLSKRYKEFTISEINNYKEEIYNCISKLTKEEAELWKDYAGRNNFFSAVIYLYYNNLITREDLNKIPILLIKLKPDRKGRDLSEKRIREDLNYLLGIVNKNQIF